MRSLRILVLAAYFPWHGHGGGRLISNLLAQLAPRHEITLLTYIEPQEQNHIPEVEQLCTELVTVPWIPREALSDVGFATTRSPVTSALKAATPTRVRRLITVLRRSSQHLRGFERTALPAEIQARQTPAFEDALDQLLQDRRFDVALAEWPEMIRYGSLVPPSVVRVFDSYELRSLTYRRRARLAGRLDDRIYWLLQWLQMRSLEVEASRIYDLFVTVSAREGAVVQRYGGTADVQVNPVGLDLTEWPPSQQEDRWPRTLIFVGRMSYGPNQDAIRYFLSRVYSRIRDEIADVRLFVIGSDPPPELVAAEGSNGIHFTGHVPEVRPYLTRGTVFVLPMRQGAGIKVKALEAMACGIPIVATPSGAEGLDRAEDGRHILVANSPENFAATTCALLHDEGLRRRIANAAQRLAREEYDVKKNVARLETLYLAKVRQRRQ